jgi:hypothetical protein
MHASCGASQNLTAACGPIQNSSGTASQLQPSIGLLVHGHFNKAPFRYCMPRTCIKSATPRLEFTSVGKLCGQGCPEDNKVHKGSSCSSSSFSQTCNNPYQRVKPAESWCNTVCYKLPHGCKGPRRERGVEINSHRCRVGYVHQDLV